MQLKELYRPQDIQEGKIADYAKGAAAGAAIGAGILTTMLPKQNTTQPTSQTTTQPTSQATTQPTSQPTTQPDDSNLAAQFPGEYDIIKRAADRNSCTGDDFITLLAIRKSENGRAGRELGILHPSAVDTDLETQAAWAAATIVKNHARWRNAGSQGDFIDFLGSRYCPVGASNDPSGLNQNWIANVKRWRSRLSQ